MRFSFGKKPREEFIIIDFTGGMGAQIISAAIFFDLSSKGRRVFADLSYFDKPEYLATPGIPGECSHWGWQLDFLGLSRGFFHPLSEGSKQRPVVIRDGAQKLALGLHALSRPEIREKFALSKHLFCELPTDVSEAYLCIHIRRGDYLNVASHIVPTTNFISIARKFSKIIERVVILSDSRVEPSVTENLSQSFTSVEILDMIEPQAAHVIMRSARVLIGSNSQFSLVAAALRPESLTIIPNRWYGDSHRSLEIPLSNRCAFQILD